MLEVKESDVINIKKDDGRHIFVATNAETVSDVI